VTDLILPYYKIPYTVETWASWYQIGTSSPTFHHPTSCKMKPQVAKRKKILVVTNRCDYHCGDAVVATTTAPSAVVTATTTNRHEDLPLSVTHGVVLVAENYFCFILSKPFEL